jgi:hypothetical protein
LVRFVFSFLFRVVLSAADNAGGLELGAQVLKWLSDVSQESGEKAIERDGAFVVVFGKRSHKVGKETLTSREKFFFLLRNSFSAT